MSNIFRKKNLDKVNSPEGLNEYMRVTNPPVWLALITVILLLCGAIIWATCSSLETKAKGLAVSTDDGIVCYISENDITDVKPGTVVKLNNDVFVVEEIDKQKIQSDTILNDYEMKLADFTDGEIVYRVNVEGNTENGSYTADIVLDNVSPITFLLGSSD